MNPLGVVHQTWKSLAGEFGWQKAQLRSGNDPESKGVLSVFRAVRQRELSPEESAEFDKVDSLRLALNRSNEPIVYYDHGVGARDTPLDPTLYVDQDNVKTTVGELPTLDGRWALLLFRLIRELKCRSCLEMGTCTGISALYQAIALQLNGEGHLVTLEGNESFVRLAQQNVARLGMEQVTVIPGDFQDTLPVSLEKYKPIDYAFVDGDHHEETTVAYYDQIAPYLSDRAIIIFDDIRWASGMWRAWQRIIQKPTVLRSFDVDRFGICIYSTAADSHKHYRIRI